MIALKNVAAALEERSKMIMMWHMKQGSGFCWVGYWTSKWQKTKTTT